MQALTILKRFSDRCESALGFNGVCIATLGEINDAIVELESLEQQNTELQARIKELEANEEKLKREWYTIGSNDNYQALLKSGKLRQ